MRAGFVGRLSSALALAGVLTALLRVCTGSPAVFSEVGGARIAREFVRFRNCVLRLVADASWIAAAALRPHVTGLLRRAHR